MVKDRVDVVIQILELSHGEGGAGRDRNQRNFARGLEDREINPLSGD